MVLAIENYGGQGVKIYVPESETEKREKGTEAARGGAGEGS